MSKGTNVGTLRDYQQQGVKFITSRPATLLGDSQGLGKTIQTISAVREDQAHRVLIFCPSDMVSVWLDEIAVWDTEAEAHPLLGSTVNKRKLLTKYFDAANPTRKYFITNWETLTVKKPLPFEDLRWSYVIADESHAIKNRRAKRTKALKAITNRGKKKIRKVALTGTPFDKDPAEMWSILNWLDPKRWSSYWRFRETYLEEENRPWGRVVVGQKYGGKLLQRDIRPWVLRRTKEEVLPELPPKQYQYIWCDISQLQYDLYQQLTDEFMVQHTTEDGQEILLDASTVLGRFGRFQQTVISPAVLDPSLPDDSPRLDAIVEYVANLGEPVVIAGNYVHTVKLLQERFARHPELKDVPVWPFHGGISKEEREEARKAFQAIPQGGMGILVGTIATMHLGITLTRASYMLFVDRSWERLKNEQMEDRIHRMGQKNAANYVIFGIPETVDERRLQAVMEKDEEFVRVFPTRIIGRPPKPGELRIRKEP